MLSNLQENNHEIKITADWLLSSISRRGGSCAYYAPIVGWSGEYPETSGYIMPTLYRCSEVLAVYKYKKGALSILDWLLEIHNEQGYWLSGFEGSKDRTPSVFNTAQILLGLTQMYRHNKDTSLLEHISKSASWLSGLVDEKGFFSEGAYIEGYDPSYYTRVAWPMLEAAKLLDDTKVMSSAKQCLSRISLLKNKHNFIENSGFYRKGPAFTHTIAYTLRGFMESARILDCDDYENIIKGIINRICVDAKKTQGNLPGCFDEKFNPAGDYCCLTGNVQLAICLFLRYNITKDIKLASCAEILIKYVQESKSKLSNLLFPKTKGAIAGSYPIWGKYMRFRYPNWAAKFYLDALLLQRQYMENNR